MKEKKLEDLKKTGIKPVKGAFMLNDDYIDGLDEEFKQEEVDAKCPKKQ